MPGLVRLIRKHHKLSFALRFCTQSRQISSQLLSYVHIPYVGNALSSTSIHCTVVCDIVASIQDIPVHFASVTYRAALLSSRDVWNLRTSADTKLLMALTHVRIAVALC
jgi:hypothetical protein